MTIDPYEYIPQPSAGVLYEPAARPAARLAGTTAVVIDAIRATTTIVAALAAGATEVVAFATDAEVRAEAARRPAGSAVTCGERLGRKIEGLDLNNSPSVMTSEAVGGRSLLLTTTNGVGAILDAMPADTVLVAALANRRAVARRCADLGRRIVFVSAGTVGTVSCEDTLVAGAVLEAMTETPAGAAFTLEDSGLVALAAWRGAKDRLAETFAATWGGAFTRRLGLHDDLEACTQVDTTDVVPAARGLPPVITAAGE
ncbi:MAG: 2-phosphosulfolactate phosphatase [Planctomycetes bacterium]|nr:2-phosphosulfolactate phosphatase [Planctomycetota bacterium]